MAQTTASVVIGRALVYIGTANAVTAVVADTVAAGTAWGGSWVELGHTKSGATVTISKDVYSLDSDQINVDLLAVPTHETYSITLNLLESTLSNLKRATSMGTLATSGSTEVLDFGGATSLDTYSIGLEGKSRSTGSGFSYGGYRRAFIWKAYATGDVEVKMAKDGETFYAVTFKALQDSTKSAGMQALEIRDNIA